MIDLSGKTAVVTGGSRGIGRAVATTLAAAIAEAMMVFFRPNTFFMCNPLNKSNLFSVR